jgi:isopenicillin-N N-acyltransferase-like protein
MVSLSGSTAEQGRQHGEHLRKLIRHNVDCYFERFRGEAGLSRRDILHRGSIYAKAIAQSNPRYFEGMTGIAAGAAVTIEEITALNVRYEILYFQYAMRQMASGGDGCTAFALAPAKTEDGHLWIGQNWDWIPEVKGALLHTVHNNGVQTLAFTEAGIFGGKIGVNSAGLALAINGISTTDDNWQRLTTPFHVRCFEILLQKNIDDAVDIIERESRACSANFLLAQTPERTLDVEAAPDQANRISPRNGCLVHTNHFVDPQAIGVKEPPDENRRFSFLRRDRLQSRIEATRVITRQQLQEWLQDHQNSPRSICRHENPDAPIDERYQTVSSIIIDVEERVLWATAGPPCQHPYHQYVL